MNKNKSNKNPYLIFILKFVLFSGIFYGFNTLFIGLTSEGGLYVPFLAKHLNYIVWWRDFTIESTATILKWMKYTVITNEYQLKVIGKAGITIVYTCLGYGIMGVFAAFTLSYPEKIKYRFRFLIIGLLLVQLLNTIRLILIVLFWKKNSNLLGMDHHDIFNIVVYILLIIFVYLWLKFFEKKANKNKFL